MNPKYYRALKLIKTTKIHYIKYVEKNFRPSISQIKPTIPIIIGIILLLVKWLLKLVINIIY